MRLIGISGKRGTGKSLLATMLEAEYGYERISLARWLKDFCKLQFNLTEEQVNGHFKESPTQYKRDGVFLTPRQILIDSGTYFRSIEPLFFCMKVAEYMRQRECEKFVIDDIRFMNELTFFRSLGAKFVRLDREVSNPINDPSETQLDDFQEWDGLLIKELNRIPEDLKVFADYLQVRL